MLGVISEYLSGVHPNSMLETNTDQSEIRNIVHALKSIEGKGVSSVFNKSFLLQQFLYEIQIVKIVPVYKADDKFTVNICRTISILPFSPKFLERLMYNRLLNYRSSDNILVDNQFGFREAHSLSMALMGMVNDISNELDNNMYSLDVFNRSVESIRSGQSQNIVTKMYHYGVEGIVLEWFNDYLTNCTQYINKQC